MYNQGHLNETFEKRPLLPNFCVPAERDLRYATAAQILILEILKVFLRLKSSFSLNLNKIEHFSKVSKPNRNISNAASFAVVGCEFTRLPPSLAVIDKKLLAGRDVFDSMKYDQVPLCVMPIFGIVFISVVKSTSPPQGKRVVFGLVFRIVMFLI